MYFISFLNDLGIIPNKNTKVENNPSLKQGQEYMDYSRMYTRQITPKLRKLQITHLSDIGIHSIVEEMDTMSKNTTIVNTQNNTQNNTRISLLEKNFNRVLDKYNSTYKLLIEELVRNNKVDKDIQQYFGKAITTNDGNYYYVNNYGYTHKYSTDAWSQNHETCPITPDTITDDVFNKLKKSHDMIVGQPCNMAGKNINNKKTGEHSWVDIKGYKHVYSNSLWKNKNKTCNIPAVQLEEETYDAIPIAGNMRDTTECIQLDIDPALWDNLAKLNKELVSLAKKINDEISKLSVKDTALQNKIVEEQKKLNGFITSLDDDYDGIKKLGENYITTYASSIDSNLQKTSYRMRYIVWFIILLTILFLTGHAYTNTTTNNRFYDIIGVGLAIIILYVVSSFIYNYLSEHTVY